MSGTHLINADRVDHTKGFLSVLLQKMAAHVLDTLGRPSPSDVRAQMVAAQDKFVEDYGCLPKAWLMGPRYFEAMTGQRYLAGKRSYGEISQEHNGVLMVLVPHMVGFIPIGKTTLLELDPYVRILPGELRNYAVRN